MEALRNKKQEKNKLTTTLVELVNESEKARLKKLQELSNIIDPSG
ncbi:putative RAB6-interacting golgin [Helianthus annuus]|uniref:RAB6-interacting golgin n=2 Tax=Helianthus annuus TaxID=4232 RepID=A0A9K3ID43_HELAN|nr:putative RAB6-interacting golgin [Helianthus annuus]KAJ0900813.1 putative RAB6-interacting golgin [Helianthus annuus]